MALIEIDGLPNLNMVDFSMAMLNNQRVSGISLYMLIGFLKYSLV